MKRAPTRGAGSADREKLDGLRESGNRRGELPRRGERIALEGELGVVLCGRTLAPLENAPTQQAWSVVRYHHALSSAGPRWGLRCVD